VRGSVVLPSTVVTYLRLIAAPVTAVALLVMGQIAAARNRTYLVDVPFTVDRTFGSTDDGRAPLELCVLGDSTVAGVGVDGPRDALPSLLAERVARRTGRAVHVVGLGRSGARTADLSAEQIPRIGAADVVVLVVGSNDVLHATGRRRLRRHTARMLADAAAIDAPVVLGGIPRFYGVAAFAQPLRAIVDGYAAALRDVQRDLASQHPDVAFVDIAALASPRFLGVPTSMSADRFHPSAVGYGFWADALAPSVVAAAGAVIHPRASR
jgi:lysophospholipase L1-like esterase